MLSSKKDEAWSGPGMVCISTDFPYTLACIDSWDRYPVMGKHVHSTDCQFSNLSPNLAGEESESSGFWPGPLETSIRPPVERLEESKCRMKRHVSCFWRSKQKMYGRRPKPPNRVLFAPVEGRIAGYPSHLGLSQLGRLRHRDRCRTWWPC